MSRDTLDQPSAVIWDPVVAGLEGQLDNDEEEWEDDLDEEDDLDDDEDWDDEEDWDDFDELDEEDWEEYEDVEEVESGPRRGVDEDEDW